MRLPRPQDNDANALAFALATATLMIGHQVAGKATRDALFLSHFEVTELPKAVIAAAVLSMSGVLLMSRLLPRYGPPRLIPLAFGLSAALFACEWLVYPFASGPVAVALYLHMALFGAILISGFWSLVNERFDPHAAKTTIARIAAAATLGGLLGGLLAERVSAIVDVRAMLIALSGLHAMCALGVLYVADPGRAPGTEERAHVRSGLRIIAATRYLQQMGALVVLAGVMAALLDYALKVEASASFATSEELVAFFATFYAAVGLITFVVQSALGPRMLQRFGIGTTIAVLPAAVLLGGSLGVALTQLWTMAALRGSQAVFTHSFFRSAFELLYTPLRPEQKRPTKTIIDVASDRLGDLLGAGLILLLLALVSELPSAVVVALAMALALVTLYVVTRLYRGYVEQLARSLRKGSVSLAREEVADATTQHILAETTLYTERALLMARIREHREKRRNAGEDEMGGSSAAAGDLSDEDLRVIGTEAPGVLPPRPLSKSERFARAVADLTSNDSARIRHALRGEFMDIRLVPYLIPLLGHDAVAEDARMELRWLVPRIIGQITDAMLDPDLPALVRQRLPGVLEVCHNPRSVDGLLHGLVDQEFSVRYSCARALARMRARNPRLPIPEEVVLAAVRREVAADRETWESRILAPDTTLPLGAPGERGLDRGTRSLEHVFTLLGLVLDPDALELALHAIAGTDRTLRGTALEYLENVLPEDVRIDLWRHIGVIRREPAPRRPPRAIVSDLKHAAERLGARDKMER